LLSKDDFKADLKNMNLKYEEYEVSKYTLTAMLGLRASSEDIQK